MKYTVSFNLKDKAISTTTIAKDGIIQVQVKDYCFKYQITLYNGDNVNTYCIPNISSIIFVGMMLIVLAHIVITKITRKYRCKRQG